MCKRYLLLAASFVLGGLITGCDGEPTGIIEPIQVLEGSWTATLWEIRSSELSRSVDLLAAIERLGLTITAQERYTWRVELGPGDATVDVGDVVAEIDSLTLESDAGAVFIYEFQVAVNSLVLTRDVEFDFDADGTADAAVQEVEFRRE